MIRLGVVGRNDNKAGPAEKRNHRNPIRRIVIYH